MIDSAQAAPESSPKTFPNTLWNPDKMSEVMKYSGAMMKPPMSTKKSITQAPRVRVGRGSGWAGRTWVRSEAAGGTGS
jgi:hypothetical protein